MTNDCNSRPLPRYLLVVAGAVCVGFAFAAWHLGHVGVRWLLASVLGIASACWLARAASARKRADLERSLDSLQLRQSLRSGDDTVAHGDSDD